MAFNPRTPAGWPWPPLFRLILVAGSVLASGLASAPPAAALPSYARQTGQ